LRFEILASQLQALNPILVLAFIPLTTYWIYPALNRICNMTSVRKIALGLGIGAFSFVLVAMAETRLQAGQSVSIMWQVGAFFILTLAEVMVYGTGLEFSYTQAPKGMKSVIMGLFLLSISLGNAFAAFVNFFIQNPDGSNKLEGASYYWFFTILMGITAVLFTLVVRRYKEENYIQSHEGLH
jgi:POT family proton-dependent oligopeptide transporter